MSTYADLIERLQQESTEWDAAEARAGILGKSMAAQLQCRYAAQHAKRAADAISRLERENKRLRRQYANSTDFWVRAAKAALAGNPGELRNRVELAEAPPVEVVLSRTQEQTA